MGERKEDGERMGEPLWKEAQGNDGRGGEYGPTKRFRKQAENVGMGLIRSSPRKLKATMHPDAYLPLPFAALPHGAVSVRIIGRQKKQGQKNAHE